MTKGRSSDGTRKDAVGRFYGSKTSKMNIQARKAKYNVVHGSKALTVSGGEEATVLQKTARRPRRPFNHTLHEEKVH